MSTTRIATLEAHPDTVFATLLDAAAELGLSFYVIDEGRRQVELRREGKAYRVSASVTDNGWGRATLHLSWDPAGSTGGGTCAKRVVRRTRAILAGMEPPPAAPPPPGG